MANCKSCRRSIKWVQMRDTGRLMPVDTQLEKIVVIGDDGQGVVVSGHLSHFATCPNADKHRKDKK